MTIQEYVKKQILLMDGAMGTYYASLTGGDYTLSEPANLTHPEIIEQIHRAYIDAGAKLIRTNTFSANPYTLYRSMDDTKRIILDGIAIARRAVRGSDCEICYSLGPIPEPYDADPNEIRYVYEQLLDTALGAGMEIILFETFSRMEQLSHLIDYVKRQAPQAQIMTSFSVNQHGYTKVGVKKDQLIDRSKQEAVAAYGFNCGIGVSHLLSILKEVSIDPLHLVALPNAGYPDHQLDRQIYQDNVEFFADKMMQICDLGVRIIGGCCGTTPAHIKRIAERLNERRGLARPSMPVLTEKDAVKNPLENPFRTKLEQGDFVYAVELDPPYQADFSGLFSAAHLMKACGVDLITIADSPLGRTRADALIMASLLKQKLGLEVLPHVSMRDKNLIALRGGLLGAHISGVRNILVVTGDPIPSDDRDEIKSVFNMNAIEFIKYVSHMNEDLKGDEFFIGAALNPYTKNLDKTIERVRKKQAAGAKYLLTQPVFDQEGIEAIRYIKATTGIKVLGGIMPLVSLKNAKFLHYEFPGISIPQEVMASFKPEATREENETIGVNLAVKLAKIMQADVDGLYFMTPFNRAGMIERILKDLRG